MSHNKTTQLLLAGCCSVSLLAYPANLLAQDDAGQETADAQTADPLINALRDRIAQLEERDAASQVRIEELESQIPRLIELATRLELIEAEPLDYGDLVTMRGRYVENSSRATPTDPSWGFVLPAQPSGPILAGAMQDAVTTQPQDAEEERLREPATTQAVDDITDQQQGRFGDRLGFEVGFGYTHFDDARINLDGFLALDAIFLGTISIDQVTADIFTLDPTVRLGLDDNVSVDASVPFLFRTSNFQSGGAGGAAGELIEETVDASGLGDVSFGGSYRLFRETANRPDLVFSARAKLPTGRDPFGVEFIEVPNSEGNLQVPETLATGSGVYGASAGVSVLKTLDPMIVFGNMTYFYNFPRNFDDIDENPDDQPGRVNVGNAFQFGAGLAFALNERSSISMSYSQRLVERTRIRLEGQEWRPIVGSQANVALVNLGATFSLSDTVTLVTNVGIGLTDDSPDMAVNIRVPFRF